MSEKENLMNTNNSTRYRSSGSHHVLSHAFRMCLLVQFTRHSYALTTQGIHKNAAKFLKFSIFFFFNFSFWFTFLDACFIMFLLGLKARKCLTWASIALVIYVEYESIHKNSQTIFLWLVLFTFSLQLSLWKQHGQNKSDQNNQRWQKRKTFLYQFVDQCIRFNCFLIINAHFFQYHI